jgi:hypothetical protein
VGLIGRIFERDKETELQRYSTEKGLCWIVLWC